MNFLLKILQGPNAGAEIALVPGVPATVGKTDACDIVLADPTLPDAPITLSVSADSSAVTLEAPGEAPRTLQPAHVFHFGTTALAVGPADAPWPPLVYPSPEPAAPSGDAPDPPDTPAPEPAPAEAPAPEPAPEEKPAKKRRFPVGLLVLLALLLLLLLGIGLLVSRHRARAAEAAAEQRARAAEAAADQALADFLTLHNLVLVPADPPGTAPTLAGNFPTRADRRRAAAEARALLPAARLDFTDDESILASANDVLALLAEGTLAATSAAGRSIALAGTAPTPEALQRALEALRADIPRLENIDPSAVVITSATVPASADPAEIRRAAARRARANANAPSGIRGVLSTPYPYILLGNGTRILEGASLGDSTVVRIEPDRITLTNSAGSFEWKP